MLQTGKMVFKSVDIILHISHLTVFLACKKHFAKKRLERKRVEKFKA